MGPPDELEGQEGPQAASATWRRLEDQIKWYDRQAGRNQRWFKSLKVVQLVAAAAVPVMAALAAPGWAAGALGGLVVVVEGVQQLFQFQQNWVSFRSTCEALKQEKFLYLAAAGPYATTQRPQALLAERVEGLVSQETAKWAAQQEETARASRETKGRPGQGAEPG